MTHLVGHALYKSARFLGVGAVVHTDVARRRLGISAHHSRHPAAVGPRQQLVRAAVGSAVIGSVAVVAWPASLTGADATMVGGALAGTAGVALYHWVRASRRPFSVAGAGLGLLSGAVVGFLGAARVVKSAVSGAVAPAAVAAAPAAAALALLAVSALVGAAAMAHPVLGPKVRSAVAGLGQPPIAIARVRPVRSAAAGEFQPAELRSPA